MKPKNEQRWRELQNSHSKLRRASGRRVFLVRCVLFSSMVCFMVVALVLVRQMNEFYAANVTIRAAHNRAPYHMRAHAGHDSRTGPDAIKCGISLDHVGDLVLHNPEHKLCESRLFFVEGGRTLSDLTTALQGGRVLSFRDDVSLDTCCESCNSQDCHGFRFHNNGCTLLAFAHIDDSTDIDFSQSLHRGYFAGLHQQAQQHRREMASQQGAEQAADELVDEEGGAEAAEKPEEVEAGQPKEEGENEAAGLLDLNGDRGASASTKQRGRKGKGKRLGKGKRRFKAAGQRGASGGSGGGGDGDGDSTDEPVEILDEVEVVEDAETAPEEPEEPEQPEQPAAEEDDLFLALEEDSELDLAEDDDDGAARQAEHAAGPEEAEEAEKAEEGAVEGAAVAPASSEEQEEDNEEAAPELETEPADEAEAEAAEHQQETAGAVDNELSMLSLGDGDGGLPTLEHLPDDLQQIDHTGEASKLQDFLGVSKTEIMPQETDQELMNKLMNQMNDRHNPKKEEESEEEKKAEKLRKAAERLAEHQIDHASNLELGKSRLKEVIPLGDYQRLTARDPLYGRHKNIFLRYRSNREMTAVAQDMADFFKKDVEYITYGKSGDRKKPQPLRSLRVGNGRRGKHVFVVATLRGCEWTSSLAVLHTAMVLKGRGESTKKLLDSVQFHFIPLANPDGFDYSHHKTPSNARSWCKNRRVAVPGYHGVDLEHNWGLDGVSWGFGKRDGAKLDNFQGPANFSEPETRALRDYMLHYATGSGRVALLHVKCCTGVITPPQVYKEEKSAIDVNRVAAMLANRVEHTDGSRYTVAPRDETFHAKNHGQMIDWAHNEANIDHAYTVEVKGAGLATRADHAKISVDPFQTLLRELETATVFVALRLLQQPIEGPAVDKPFKQQASAAPSDTAAAAASSSSGGSSAHKSRKKKKL